MLTTNAILDESNAMLDESNLILDEFRLLHEDRRSGVLSLTRNGDRVDVFFREGLIEAASSNLDARRLGDYLVKDGYLQPKGLDAVQSEARRRRICFGEALVRKGLLDE